VFAKTGSTNKLSLEFRGAAPNTPDAVFNLDSGTVESGSGTITPAGNGWFRCSITDTSVDTSELAIIGRGISGTIGDYIYLWGAQLEQNSDVGPYVKTEASIATKVDAEPLGLLVEESRTNDVYESENIGNVSPWQRTNVTQTAGFDAPDGTTNAVRLLETTVNNGHFVYWSSASFLTTATASVFVKPIGREYLGIRAYKASNAWENVVFNVTGEGSVVNYQSGSSSSYSNVQGFIEKHADGWYRISVTCTSAGGVNLPAIFSTHTTATPTLDSSGEEDFVGDTSKGFYIWGAQIESGSFPTSYIRNTTGSSTVTRSADVTSIEGNDFGTFNLLQYSEEFDNAGWTKSESTVSANNYTAPDGTFTAEKVEETSATAEHRIAQASSSGATTNTVAFSVFVKAAERTKIRLAFSQLSNWVGGGGAAVIFDLQNGTATPDSSTPAAYGIVPYSNGWYRCYIVGTPTISLTPNCNLFTYTTTAIFAGTVGSGVYVWGAQLEQSSTATPYVKSDVTWTSRASNATYYDYTGSGVLVLTQLLPQMQALHLTER
jgi:hypothetical protein